MNCELEIPKLLEDDVVDCSTSSTAASKKDNILERINKRNKDRQNYLDVKLELRNKENLQIEGADYFFETFSDRVREIEARVQNIIESAEKRTGTDLPSSELVRLFATVTVEIQELQRYLTASTIFLTDYKIKSCQNVLNDLTSNCEEARLKLIPKKKFGFSGRKVAPKAVINPKIAADKHDSSSEKSSISTAKAFIWTLSERKNEHIVMRGEEVNGKDVTISNMSHCFIELQGHPGSVQISNASDCTFLCGPIARSLFAENCRACTIAVACQQMRLHSSTACRIYLHVTCRAIIEDCKQIEIASYCYDYPEIESDFLNSKLDKAQNNFTDVADFNWLSPDVPSPNWKLLKDCAEPNWSELRGQFKEKSAENTVL